MAIALTDLSHQVSISLPASTARIAILLIHECPLVRAGLRSIVEREQDMEIVGEAGDDPLPPTWTHPIDVVLLDGDLPGDLIERVDQLRLAGGKGIVVLTASPDEETLFRLLEHGACAYEWSYISPEDLLTKMRRVALGECLISGDVLLAQAPQRQPSSRQQNDKEREDATVAKNCPLTVRERDVLAQIAAGHRGQQIKEALCISEQTVKNHLTSILKKLGVSDRTAAVALALHHHWIAFGSVSEGAGRQSSTTAAPTDTADKARSPSKAGPWHPAQSRKRAEARQDDRKKG